MAKINTKPDKDPNKGGRPSLYDAEYHPNKAMQLAMLGYTDKQIAETFGIATTTFSEWKVKYPYFTETLRKGKVEADAEIAHSLFKRAKGYAHPDTDVRVIDGKIIKTGIIKYYPPDTGAAMAWLKNRQRGLWREKQEIDHTSSDRSMSPLKDMTDEDLEKELKKYGLKKTPL